MSNWFLAACPGNVLVAAWSDEVERIYFSHKKIKNYYWVMHLFEYLIVRNHKLRRIWDDTPKISMKGPILLKRVLSEPDYAEPLPDYVDENAIPVFKASSTTKFDSFELGQAIKHRRSFSIRRMINELLHPQNREKIQ